MSAIIFSPEMGELINNEYLFDIVRNKIKRNFAETQSFLIIIMIPLDNEIKPERFYIKKIRSKSEIEFSISLDEKSKFGKDHITKDWCGDYVWKTLFDGVLSGVNHWKIFPGFFLGIVNLEEKRYALIPLYVGELISNRSFFDIEIESYLTIQDKDSEIRCYGSILCNLTSSLTSNIPEYSFFSIQSHPRYLNHSLLNNLPKNNAYIQSSFFLSNYLRYPLKIRSVFATGLNNEGDIIGSLPCIGFDQKHFLLNYKEELSFIFSCESINLPVASIKCYFTGDYFFSKLLKFPFIITITQKIKDFNGLSSILHLKDELFLLNNYKFETNICSPKSNEITPLIPLYQPFELEIQIYCNSSLKTNNEYIIKWNIQSLLEFPFICFCDQAKLPVVKGDNLQVIARLIPKEKGYYNINRFEIAKKESDQYSIRIGKPILVNIF